MRRQQSPRAGQRPQQGFTLIELVLVIVVLGIIAATLTIFLVPAFNSYIASRERAALYDSTDVVIRRVLREVRLAVPNSVRLPNSQCVEMVPTSTGGRVRMAFDPKNDVAPPCTPSSTCSAWLDVTQPVSQVDTLSSFQTPPNVGDYFVVGNQNGNEVYAGPNSAQTTTSVAQISKVVPSPDPSSGAYRLSFASATQFPAGFNSGRFDIVPGGQGSVYYVCSNVTGAVDASGNGVGALYRLSNNGLPASDAAYPSACPAVANASLMASNVTGCNFVYSPSQGATQQFGFVWLQLQLTRSGTTATVAAGAHVLNAP